MHITLTCPSARSLRGTQGSTINKKPLSVRSVAE